MPDKLLVATLRPSQSVARMRRLPAPGHLWNHWIDFLCLGGGAAVVLGVIALVLPQGVPSPQQEALLAPLLVLINYPHFAHSYQLFYRDFRHKVFGPALPLRLRVRYAVAGLAIPAVLLGLVAAALVAGSARVLGYGANLMFFLVGWHYVKQGYGILIVDAVKKNFVINNRAKQALRLNCYACWMVAWLAANQIAQTQTLQGLRYVSFAIPVPFFYVGCALALVTSAASLACFYNMLLNEKNPPWNGVIAYLETVYMWVVFFGGNPLVMALIPTFHSLQYEAVVWRYQLNAAHAEQARQRLPRWMTPSWRLAVFAVAGLVLGYLGFVGVPRLLSSFVGYDHDLFSSGLFVFIFMIFINIHHYFIDNVIWRRENPDLHKYLIGAAT